MFKAHGDDDDDGDGSEELDDDEEDEDEDDEDKDENSVERTYPSLSVSVCCRRLDDERRDGGCRFRLSSSSILSSSSLPLISLLRESLGGEAVEEDV